MYNLFSSEITQLPLLNPPAVHRSGSAKTNRAPFASTTLTRSNNEQNTLQRSSNVHNYFFSSFNINAVFVMGAMRHLYQRRLHHCAWHNKQANVATNANYKMDLASTHEWWVSFQILASYDRGNVPRARHSPSAKRQCLHGLSHVQIPKQSYHTA